MPDNYFIALFLHIVGVFGIAGAATISWLALMVMQRLRTVQEVRSWATVAVWADRAFPVAAVLVIAAGVFMVEDRWEWGDGWMNVSLAALVIMLAAGGLLLTRRVAAIHRDAEAAGDGPVPAELRRQINNPLMWGTLHAFALGLIGIVWNMTTKPEDAQAGMVIVLAFVFGAAIGFALSSRRT
jgi:hypothetical protein